MRKMVLSDDMWFKVEPLLPGKSGDRGRTGENNRLFLETVLWFLRTGAPWRDIPVELGPWGSVYTRYNRWSHKGNWQSIFEALSVESDFEYLMVDGSIIRVHQDGAPKKTDQTIEAVGKSRGGQTTKIHAAYDSLGNPVRFILLPSQDSEFGQSNALIEGFGADYIIADKGYDSNEFIAEIKESGAKPVIPPKKNRKEKREYDYMLTRSIRRS